IPGPPSGHGSRAAVTGARGFRGGGARGRLIGELPAERQCHARAGWCHTGVTVPGMGGQPDQESMAAIEPAMSSSRLNLLKAANSKLDSSADEIFK
ncbi:MAG: hypothetical protein ACREMY_18530, partial [bacterium]